MGVLLQALQVTPSIPCGVVSERIEVMSDDTLLLDEVSDEALEAAAEMDHSQRGMTLQLPIWCPDSSGGPKWRRDTA